jgi:hypothetical protein
MIIREFDDGHQEFLIEPKSSYFTNTGPILEKQRIRAVERNTIPPFQYEIRENNNGTLNQIWISCRKFENKDMELNLINPLIWTFDTLLHPDPSKQTEANRRPN